jgi:hypothetical protein
MTPSSCHHPFSIDKASQFLQQSLEELDFEELELELNNIFKFNRSQADVDDVEGTVEGLLPATGFRAGGAASLPIPSPLIILNWF